MNIRRVLIANRGEIAVRINRACKALDVSTVQVYSAADRDSLAVQLADQAIEIGPAPAAKSYLRIDAIIDAARASAADAVHPGYGFLAENGDFADAVVAAGLIFIGPAGDAIRLLGDKVAARQVAAAAGVPTVPGSSARLHDVDAGLALAASIAYPVMIKAAAGGGGRGIRVVHNAVEFARQFPQAAAEAAAAFGDGGLYVEKLIASARHIEVQILGDGQRYVHCFERECSLQRRRQKVWEEAPAFHLSAAVRAQMCTAALKLAARVAYKGVATVEFLYDRTTESFYFIEVNTRIQVEHPVTEMVTGIDLVAEMIRIAGGERLSIEQDDVVIDGHAIECRINAENPKTFAPSPGLVTDFHAPGGLGVRLDSALYAGYTIPPFYDSLVGKLIVHGRDREECIARLNRCLGEMVVGGIETSIPLFQELLQQPDIIAGKYDIHWLERWMKAQADRVA